MKKTIVIFAALALVFVFAGTTMAADWSLYGSARFATFWENNDKDSPTNTSNSSPAQDDSDLLWNNQGNIRFGGTATAGDIGGGYEAGFDGGEFYLRKLYGTWDFGSGQLLVGQTYTPVVQFLSNQVGGGDADLLGTGAFYPGRQPMLQLSMSGFKVALVKPNVGTPDTTATIISLGPGGGGPVAPVANAKAGLFGYPAADTDVTLPKIELSYKFSSDMFWVEPFVGYQTYDLVQTNDTSISVDSYVVGIGGAVTFGPAQVKASAYMAQNSGAYGATGGYVMTNPHANKGNPAYVGTEMKDNDEFGGLVVVVFNISDTMSAELGGGMRNNEVELTQGVKTKSQVYSVYANLPIKMADGFVITPEIGMVDGGDLETGATKTKQGTDTYFGAKWQIDF
jgi:hypothetical protein